MKPINIINSLRSSEGYIEAIFLNGGCYNFHLFLKSIYPQAVPMINKEKNHVVSKINNKKYDIGGENNSEDFFDLTLCDLDTVQKWSFSKYSALSLGECKFCEEPILL